MITDKISTTSRENTKSACLLPNVKQMIFDKNENALDFEGIPHATGPNCDVALLNVQIPKVLLEGSSTCLHPSHMVDIEPRLQLSH